MARVLTPRAEDFPRWYQDLIAKAELADNGPVRGTMVIRPAGYAIWERMQAEMDARIKAAGARERLLPALHPGVATSSREAEHVEGFSPELAVVTHGGGKQLAEPVVVRPTSETVIGEFMAKWVDSYRDLPLLLNQWANVVRWELRPRLFLRTSEFLWQEGHTAHADEADARAYARRILHEVYQDFMVGVLAIPVVVGLQDRPGAVRRRHRHLHLRRHDGRRQGAAAGHQPRAGPELRQGLRHHLLRPSRRRGARLDHLLGHLHPDARRSDHVPRRRQRAAGAAAAGARSRRTSWSSRTARESARRPAKLRDALRDAGVRVALDDRVDTPFGRRAVDAELKGYPVRVEVGPRDLAAGNAVVVRRVDGSKTPVAGRPTWSATVLAALDADQRALLRRGAGAARARAPSRCRRSPRRSRRPPPAGPGCRGRRSAPQGEAEANGQGVTVRCLVRADGSVPESEDEPDLVAILARAY